MRAIAVGEAASQVQWLWPDAASLQAISRPLSLATWHETRHDPAALLLLAATEFHALAQPPSFPFHHFRAVNSVRRVVRAFETRPTPQNSRSEYLPWRHPMGRLLLCESTRLARYSEAIACFTRTCDPSVAWTGGMLASLGWFAVLSESPDAVEDCLEDIDYSTFPLESERELWGLNHAEIARRVARRMHLPIWLQILVGHIDLTADSIRSLGGNPELVATVRTAMELVQRNGQRLQLMTRSHLAADLNLLRLDAEELPAIESRFRENDTDVYLNRDWTDPRYVPLLPDLLQACLGDRLLSGPQTEGVEREVDQLHQIVHQQERTEQNRLDDSRLASLAEFAAGAAHEINNPLAIVSGNAQSLLKCETDESRRESLHSIIRQANRIHGILTEVMQFARPTVPALRSRGLDEDLRQVIDQLRPLAESKRVSIEYIGVETPLTLELDPKQIQTVYAALLRNAIEAAPVGGWVRISLGRLGEQLEVRFEDNGPGMTEVQKRHAFDPFYSGRTAGRGRGFGLPIAWRLAREHGGEVRDDSQPGEPTRIVVRLPLHRCEMMPIRQSA